MSRRNRRSVSKEDANSFFADSGVSLSSPGEIDVTNEEDAKYDIFTDDSFSDATTTTTTTTHTEAAINVPAEDEDKDEDEETTQPIETPTKKQKKRTKKPSSSSSSSHQKPRKQYICHICDKHFGGNTDVRRHLLIHSDERPFKCDQCSKSYRQAVNLYNHVKSIHESRKEFACSLCSRSFALKERLKLHMRIHSGEKPYQCPKCPKAFARGGQLQQHLVIHDGVKKLTCEKCSSTFSTTANLRLHMKRHEEGPNHLCTICKEMFLNSKALRSHQNAIHFKVQEFDCDLCKKTIRGVDLPTHMKLHSNVKTHICEVCNSFFTQKSQYNVHMRMHTGERPYPCWVCWQSFAHSSVLKLHIRKHTGEKPFKCLLCKDDYIAFSQLAHLKTHMKKIHKKENSYMCEGCNQFFKIKIELQAHMEICKQCEKSFTDSDKNDQITLSRLRFLIAVLLKKISNEEKLQKLGFEKRLIDNVIIASLKLASKTTHEDRKMNEIDRLKSNIEEFLNWIVPVNVMEKFRQESLNVENILDKIVTMYLKQS